MERIETEYMVFQQVAFNGTTQVWNILNRKSHNFLGQVRWYTQWRQYCLMPERGTVFNRGCLEEITVFIGHRMEEWRRG